MARVISFDEKKQIQYGMLQEIHAFCVSHGIRYSLAYGTLLGAVRHKGFIPWDDDVDILMPLPDLLKFRSLFKSDNIKYCDIDTEPHFGYPFSRIVHKGSYSTLGMAGKGPGVCIDLYVIVSIPDGKEDMKSFFDNVKPLYDHRIKLMRYKRRIQRFLPVSTIPGHDKSIRLYRDYLFKIPYGSTGMYYAVAGPLSVRDKIIYPYDLFDNLVMLQFEGQQFCATAHYDKFLTLRYGDYMQLPPEDQRHPYHGGHYYWR